MKRAAEDYHLSAKRARAANADAGDAAGLRGATGWALGLSPELHPPQATAASYTSGNNPLLAALCTHPRSPSAFPQTHPAGGFGYNPHHLVVDTAAPPTMVHDADADPHAPGDPPSAGTSFTLVTPDALPLPAAATAAGYGFPAATPKAAPEVVPPIGHDMAMELGLHDDLDPDSSAEGMVLDPPAPAPPFRDDLHAPVPFPATRGLWHGDMDTDMEERPPVPPPPPTPVRARAHTAPTSLAHVVSGSVDAWPPHPLAHRPALPAGGGGAARALAAGAARHPHPALPMSTLGCGGGGASGAAEPWRGEGAMSSGPRAMSSGPRPLQPRYPPRPAVTPLQPRRGS